MIAIAQAIVPRLPSVTKKEEFSIIFGAESNESEAESNESEAESNESEAEINELKLKISAVSDKDISRKDKERLFMIIDCLGILKDFNGVEVAEVLSVSDQVARKVLRKVEKYGIIYGKGSTKDKKYFFLLT